MTNRIIVYLDPLSAGHHKEQLAFTLHAAAAAGARIIVFAPETLWQGACALAGDDSRSGELAANYVAQTEGFAEKKSMLEAAISYAVAHNVAHIFFPILDYFLLPLLVRCLKGGDMPIPWSGVFFRDGFNFLREDKIKPKEVARAVVRLFSLRYVLRHNASGVLTYNRSWRVPMPVKVTWLPDAQSSLDAMAEKASLVAGWPIPHPARSDTASVRFVIFGAMEPRKGLVEILEAFLALENGELFRIELKVLGKFGKDEKYRERAQALMVEMIRRGARVLCQDRYVSEPELDYALKECDVVLAPYLQHQGSSGVVGLATQYGRPLLTQDCYQIGEMVRENSLGISVNCHEKNSLVTGLRHFLDAPIAISDGMRRLSRLQNYSHSMEVMKTHFLHVLAQSAG